MAVAYFREFDAASTAEAMQVAERVQQQVGSTVPTGGLYHAEGPTDDGGFWAFDVWDSEEAAERFYREVLGPVLQSMKVSPAPPRKLSVRWETSQLPSGG